MAHPGRVNPISPPLLVTLGDPNGLGPELACRYLAEIGPTVGPLLLIGPESALEHHRAALGLPHFWRRTARPETALENLAATGEGIALYTPPELKDFVPAPGKAEPAGGRAAGLSLDAACDLLLRRPTNGARKGAVGGGAANGATGSGKGQTVQPRGLVTLPLNKAMLQEAGFAFPGHTEFLARRAGLAADEVCMHLCGDRLRVSLVTTHPRLRDVPDLITGERILRCLRLTAGFLAALELVDVGPIAVCGLNPHAGEAGKIGLEEIEVIAPAIAEAQAWGLNVTGPLPADTVFHRAAKGEFPAVLAMYHDQGLGPLKLLHFHAAVNVTLGLPFARTSVDHGTGYDLVGRGTADTGSFAAALDLARRLTTAATTASRAAGASCVDGPSCAAGTTALARTTRAAEGSASSEATPGTGTSHPIGGGHVSGH